jgi:hypothetical protein
MLVKQSVEEQYKDVLQNIETIVISIYRKDPELLDWEVGSTDQQLLRRYQTEWKAHTLRPPSFSNERMRRAYEGVVGICEWCLGREELVTEGGETASPIPELLSLGESFAVHNRFLKSVRLWTKEGGRQGYLNFTNEFIS